MATPRPTLREYCGELKVQAHGLHHALSQLSKQVRPLLEGLPIGDQRSTLAFALTSAEAALKEHNPGETDA
jgi:hypothetical protein